MVYSVLGYSTWNIHYLGTVPVTITTQVQYLEHFKWLSWRHPWDNTPVARPCAVKSFWTCSMLVQSKKVHCTGCIILYLVQPSCSACCPISGPRVLTRRDQGVHTSLLLVLLPCSWYYLPPPGTTSLLQVWMRAHIPGETNTELGARAHVGDFRKSGCSSSIRTANLGAKKQAEA